MRMRSASYPGSCAPDANALYASPAKKSPNMTRVPKFLRCLYDILHNEDQTVLSWAKDGTHFQIYNTKRLEVEVLPKYFKHGKFASFQRQLNNFGFRKWTKTQSNVCTFSHHHYVRRHPQQLVELVIQQNESTIKADECGATVMAMEKHQGGKRKRCESEEEVKTAKAVKKEHKEPAFKQQRPPSFPMLKNEQSAFEFEVESWSLMADIAPLEWATKAQPVVVKAEAGNETPTSAANFGEVPFDFTMEELDDILLTTSDADLVNEHTIDIRLLNEYYGQAVQQPVAPVTWEAELFGKSELEMYMHESELWTAH